MDLIQVVENLSPEMYERLKHAAETGRWPEGTRVDEAQVASALQIVMAYQSKILKSDENMSIGPDGNIVSKTKRELKAQFTSATAADKPKNDEQQSTTDIARFTNI